MLTEKRKEVNEQRHRLAQQALEAGHEILKGFERTVELRAAEGNTEKEILSLVEKESADMVVVGGRGLNGISDFFLGSVSRRILRNASGPVWIARADNLDFEKTPRPALTAPLRVLLGFDGSPYAFKACEVLMSSTATENLDLKILHVVQQHDLA